MSHRNEKRINLLKATSHHVFSKKETVAIGAKADNVNIKTYPIKKYVPANTSDTLGNNQNRVNFAITTKEGLINSHHS